MHKDALNSITCNCSNYKPLKSLGQWLINFSGKEPGSK